MIDIQMRNDGCDKLAMILSRESPVLTSTSDFHAVWRLFVCKARALDALSAYLPKLLR